LLLNLVPGIKREFVQKLPKPPTQAQHFKFPKNFCMARRYYCFCASKPGYASVSKAQGPCSPALVSSATMDDKLTPADPSDLAQAIAFALRFDRRKRYNEGDQLMA
jgi:hypothetical protein